MAKIRAILIDDEQGAISVLTNLLQRDTQEIEIIEVASNLKDGVAKIEELKPNVVFLDVQMPNYAGYEIASFIEKIEFEIIFVTAYNQFAIKAFELNAVDYLVKPIDREKLAVALQKLKDKLNQKKALIDYKGLLKIIKDKEHKQIVLPELGNRRVISLDTIVAIKADGAYSIIYIINKSKITTSKNLKYFEDVLSISPSFFRTHRGWIVNLNHIELLNKTEQIITLANGLVEAKISRSKITDIEEAIK